MAASQIFINIPVKDLDKSIAFFTKLGYTFNPQFTDKNATCMIIGQNIFAMLLVEPFFKTFLEGKEISNAFKTTEAIICLNAESKAEVDNIIAKAVAAGGKALNTDDHGWMYGSSYEDLDGHYWNIVWMDPAGPPKQ